MTILEYGELLKQHAPCSEGLAAFAKCHNRKDVFSLIGDPLITDYFLRSIEDGWGPTVKDVESIFRPYINGGYTITNVIDDRRIRAQVWCHTDNVEIGDDIRWLVLIGCRGEVFIKDWQVVKIFLDARCSVRVKCAPNSIVYIENYGGNIIEVDGSCKITRK